MNISIITPTIRPDIIPNFLDYIKFQTHHIHEVILINNLPEHKETLEWIIWKDDYKQCNIKLLFNSSNSSSTARNLWINAVDKESDIILFLDDDTEFGSDFLERISTFFNNYPQANWGVANIHTPSRKIWLAKKIGLFLLTWSYRPFDFYIWKWGFNAMPLINSWTMRNAERTSGCAMFFRKSILEEWYRFPSRFLKYSLMEDCFLSYAIHKDHPNSLYYTPDIHITHLETPSARIPNSAKIYQNIIHRYLFVKRFWLSLIRYLWTMLIMCIFDCLTFMSLKPFIFYTKWLHFLFKNRKSIQQDDFDFNTFIFITSSQ